MKTKLLLFIALLSSAFTFSQINVTESFETGFPSTWTTNGSVYGFGLVYEPSYSCNGNYSMATTSNVNNPWAIIYTSSYISNGNEISISFMYRPKYSYSGNANIYYEINNSGTWNMIGSASQTSSTSCNLVSRTIASGVIPTGTPVKFRMQLNWSVGATNAEVYLDNVNISQSTLSSQNFNQNNLEVALYPNPAKDLLNIEMTNEVKSIEIYNIQGQRVKVENQKQIIVSDLANGMYMIKIQDIENGVSTKKFIKQ